VDTRRDGDFRREGRGRRADRAHQDERRQDEQAKAVSPHEAERTGGRRPTGRAALTRRPAELSGDHLELADNEEAAGPDKQQEDYEGLIQGVEYLACHSMLILQCSNTEEGRRVDFVGSPTPGTQSTAVGTDAPSVDQAHPMSQPRGRPLPSATGSCLAASRSQGLHQYRMTAAPSRNTRARSLSEAWE